MNIEQITTTLTKKFQTDNKLRKIIFWYDDKAEFADQVDCMKLENVKLHKLDPNNSFYTKYLLEKEDPTSNYLIYSATHRPKDLENLLLDTYLYSELFTADKAGIIMTGLGIDNPGLKDFFNNHASFFASNQRSDDFAVLRGTIANPNEKDFELAILCVLTKGKQLSIDHVTKAIILAGLNEDKNDLFREIVKFDLANAFWIKVEQEFGYKSDKPTIRNLFNTIVLTSFKSSVYFDFPKDWDVFCNGNKNTCSIFLSNWLNHSRDSRQLENLLKELEVELDLEPKLKAQEIGDFLNSDIFKAVDKVIIENIIANLAKTKSFEDYASIIKSRETGHWYNSSPQIHNIYQALLNALKMFEFKYLHNDRFTNSSAIKIWELYISDYYRMDQYYRLFYSNFDKVDGDTLKKQTKQEVEDLYTNWYLEELSFAWHEVIKDELKESWPIKVLRQQQDFYETYVSPILTENDRDKVFVVISDAMRYEVAQQIHIELERETRGEVRLSSLQGVIPSYTKLGMASLLPHNEITMLDDRKLLVDGMNSDGIAGRKQILQSREINSTAIRWDELKGMERNEARNAIKGYRIIYIYQDIIDAQGDEPVTEDNVFNACTDTVNEIKTLVKRLCNELNGSKVFVTADHGFIYKRDQIAEDQKIKREDIDAIQKNRRFFITKDNLNIDGCITFPMDFILKNKLFVLTPNGYLRFKTQGGGEKYVHGGSTLQEVVIPLIEYKHVRADRDNEALKPSAVDIDLINISKVITNNIVPLNFFQKDKVNGKHLKREIKIGFWDPQTNQLISDEKILVADSQEEDVASRQHRVALRIKNGNYEKGKKYELRLRPLNDGIAYKVIPFEINITINADF